MKSTRCLLTALTCLTPLLIQPAQCQPDPNNGARAENPPNRNPGGNRMRAAGERIRAQLTAAGVTETAAQDAVVLYLTTEMQQRNRLMELGNRVNMALRAETPDEATVRSALQAYKEALDADRIRRKEAEAQLLRQVDYTRNPRLEAFLLLTGAVGDGPVLMYSLDQGRRNGQMGPRGEGQNPRNNGEARANRPAERAERQQPNDAPRREGNNRERPRRNAPAGFGNTPRNAP